MFLLFEAVEVKLFEIVTQVHFIRNVRQWVLFLWFSGFRMLPFFEREVAVIVDGVGTADAFPRSGASGITSRIAAVDANVRFGLPLVG